MNAVVAGGVRKRISCGRGIGRWWHSIQTQTLAGRALYGRRGGGGGCRSSCGGSSRICVVLMGVVMGMVMMLLLLIRHTVAVMMMMVLMMVLLVMVVMFVHTGVGVVGAVVFVHRIAGVQGIHLDQGGFLDGCGTGHPGRSGGLDGIATLWCVRRHLKTSGHRTIDHAACW